MKHFLLLLWFLFVAISGCFAQTSADTTGLAGPHHLLWFKGYWKSSNTFIITGNNANTGSSSNSGSGTNTGSSSNSGSSAYTGSGSNAGNGYVTVTSDGKLLLQTPGINTWNQKVDSAIQQIDVWEEQLNADANNVDLTTHHLNEAQLPDVESLKDQWSKYKIDPKQDILSADENANENADYNSKLNNLLAMNCEHYKPWYDEIMAYYKAHKNDKDKDLHNPEPPQLDYTCYACDSLSRQENDTIVAHYVKEFVHPEDILVKKGLEIEHVLETFVGRDDEFGPMPQQFVHLWDENKKNPSQSGPCAYIDMEDLNNAIREIDRHEYRRAVKLLYDNLNNFKAVQAVAKTYLLSARSWTMLTGRRSTNQNMAELAGIYRQLFDYYYQKLKQNDWTQIGNFTYLFSLIRGMALLGADDNTFNEFFGKLKSIINNFQLTIEPDVKVGRSDGYALAHLKGKCFIIPDFERDSDQCYKWVIADDHAVDLLGFRKSKPVQQIDCDLITNEIVAPDAQPVYIGTKHYVTNLQRLHMDFCNPGSDTLLLSGFYPNPKGDGIWQFPHNIKQNLGINGADQYFKNIADMERLANSGEAEEMANKIKAKAEQLKVEMEAMQKKMNSSGDNKFSNFQQIMEMAQKAKGLTSNIKVAPILYLDFQLPVTNNSPVLVNKRFDAKQINPEISQALVYAYFTVKIENLANSKK